MIPATDFITEDGVACWVSDNAMGLAIARLHMNTNTHLVVEVECTGVLVDNGRGGLTCNGGCADRPPAGTRSFKLQVVDIIELRGWRFTPPAERRTSRWLAENPDHPGGWSMQRCDGLHLTTLPQRYTLPSGAEIGMAAVIANLVDL